MHHDTEIDDNCEQPICLCSAVISPAAEDSFDLDEVVRCEECINRHGIARVISNDRHGVALATLDPVEDHA